MTFKYNILTHMKYSAYFDSNRFLFNSLKLIGENIFIKLIVINKKN